MYNSNNSNNSNNNNTVQQLTYILRSTDLLTYLQFVTHWTCNTFRSLTVALWLKPRNHKIVIKRNWAQAKTDEP